MVTRRIDAARKVMVGGKVESRSGYDYTGDGNLEWKIVANNERSDNSICKTYAAAQSYSPFPDGTKFKVYSPADAGSVRSEYDPYAKLSPELELDVIFIVDEDNNIIGESGRISSFDADTKAGTWDTVTLTHHFQDPVVVVTPLSYGGSDPSVVRVSDVDSATDTFKVRSEEWEYKDGGHAKETVSYLVFEKGAHVLAGGQKIIAGIENVDTSWDTIDTSSADFSEAPVFVSQDVDDDSFEIKLQEEEDYLLRGDHLPHPEEEVAYIGFEPGDYTDGATAFLQVGTQNIDTNEVDGKPTFDSNDFKATSKTPFFLATIQTYNDGDPASLRYKSLDNDSVLICVEEEKSADNEMDHDEESVGYVVVSPVTFNLALLVEEEPTGLLQSVANKVRLGISFYRYTKDADIYNGEIANGGTLNMSIPYNPFIKGPDVNTGYREISTPIKSTIANIVDGIEHYPLVWGTTPLAENYFEIIRYFQQENPHYDLGAYDVNNTWDPYYFEDPNGDGDLTDAGKIRCAASNILLFTDGEPYKDSNVPVTLSGYDFLDFDQDSHGGDCYNSDANSRACEDNLNDLSKWAFCGTAGNSGICTDSDEGTEDDHRDLRDDLDGNQYLTTYTVAFGGTSLPTILQETADYGGGKAYLAGGGAQLKSQLTSVFDQILGRSSGTAASVISNTRGGEGAIYQSVFFPKKERSNSEATVNWVGQTHALLVDEYGYMHEDSNSNKHLDPLSDRIVMFKEDGSADVYVDANANRELDSGESAANVPLDDLKYLWNTSSWLNSFSDTAAETQRSTYLSASANRYIFTWIDTNNDGFVDDEVVPFVAPSSVPTIADLRSPANIYPYLHLYPSFMDRPLPMEALIAEDSANSTTYFDELLGKQTQRQINYVRGSDGPDCPASLDCINTCADEYNQSEKGPSDRVVRDVCELACLVNNSACNTQDLVINSKRIDGTAMRSRQFDYDNDGDTETWRLGDIVYSTPTVVARPAENFHLLYGDISYVPFVKKYNNRRQVVYAGANDGMIHAFNGGFFNAQTKTFCTDPDCDSTIINMPALGAELWAYVPYNLLPHLYWLTDSGYDEETHIYYIDQKPRIFDAKIFTAESACSDVTADNCIHPNGWGTVMVVGMRLGGGSIIADMDKTDGKNPVDGTDRIMKSAFVILDITNPEEPPTLLSELVMPKMGFATSYPTVVVTKDGDHDGIFEDSENKWYLAFGSGPADSEGNPGTVNTDGDFGENYILDDVKSLQPGQFYMVDLVDLVANHGVPDADRGVYATFIADEDPDTTDTNTFISDPVSADFDLDYNADAVYFGTISGEPMDWAGKLRRIVIDNDSTLAHWEPDSILMDVKQPVSAAPAIGQDNMGRNWIFVGTGRYFTADDKNETDSTQSYYGLKEPLDSGVKDWSTLTRIGGTLMDVSDAQIFTDQSIAGLTSTNWGDLVISQDAKDGWYLDFSAGERNLGQAALLGGLLSFTTFTPASDLCAAGGRSDLWALYYKTGTAHFTGILGTTPEGTKQRANNTIDLGRGLATSPNIHVGREGGSEGGSTVFVQSSSGKITRIEEANPDKTRSGLRSWRLE